MTPFWLPLLGRGNAQTAALGAVTAAGADLTRADTLEGGEIKFYTFTVPSGLASVQVSLENITGNPWLHLPTAPGMVGRSEPYYWDYYGIDMAGAGATGQDSQTFVTLANPAPGTYTAAVRASPSGTGAFPNATYTVRVHGQAPVPVTFDGGTSPVTGQASGSWNYFQVTVPAGALGWDVRLINVTSGSPQLVVARDQLPQSFATTPGAWDSQGHAPGASSQWPSGNQWAAGADLSGYTYNAGGSAATGRILEAGMGQPLQPGTYYIGVSDIGGTASMSYTLQSRGIGTGRSIPVTTLAYAGGSDTRSNLAPREAAYYKVTVPAGQTSWQVKLGATTGDVALAVNQGVLPNVAAGMNIGSCEDRWNGGGGIAMQKVGDEHYLLLPTYALDSNNQPVTTLAAGDYYLAVISDGGTNVGATPTNQNGPQIGTGNAGYTLLGRGNAQTAALGAVTAAGADLTRADTLEGGEIKFYTFTVPSGLASVQVSLENITGNPWLHLPTAPGMVGRSEPYYWDYYGIDMAGAGATGQDSQTFVTLANPAPGTYTAAVRASPSGTGAFPNATYTVRVHGQAPVPVTFDGGTSPVTGQASGSWNYFQVTVPAGALGWDVRLINVTSGSPQLVVARDQLPQSFATTPGAWDSQGHAPGASSQWPSGNQWAAGADLSGYTYNAGGSAATGRILEAGMGQPLQPGTYYIGVSDIGGTASMSYTLQSRGIGTGRSIPVTTLAYAGGSDTRSNLAPREAAYYKVTVPAGQTSWQVKLGATTGDVALAVNQGVLPNVAAGMNIGSCEDRWNGGGGIAMQKVGDEHYLLLPTYALDSNNQPVTTLAAGDYYLAVISDGGTNVGATPTNQNGPQIGTGNAGYTLLGRGNAQTAALGAVTAAGADLTRADTLEGGEIKFYTFTVPSGLASVQVSLENITGNPWLHLPTAPGMVGRSEPYYWDYYGIDMAGAGATGQDSQTFVTLANPAPGTYTAAVRASPSGTGAFPDAGYTVRVHPLPPVVLNFSPSQNAGNGGTNTDRRSVGDGQTIYYKVQVPATLNGQPVLGWRVGVALSSGTVNWSVSTAFPPPAGAGTNTVSATGADILNITPPLLAAGTWYIQVTGQGSANYALTSQPITLYRPAWSMPAQGQPVTTTGLASAGAVFADTGINPDGSAVLDPLTGTVTDQGIDLANGDYHYYAFKMPPGNAGIIRAQLIAISGNPNLYLQYGQVPSQDYYLSNAQRALTGTTNTQYGVWPVADSRITGEHPAGTWYVVVTAAGSSNARYRLRLSSGNDFSGGVVQDLTLNGGSLTGQSLASGDWRYYRVQVPANAAPASWQVTFGATLGNVDLYIRDTAPPGSPEVTSGYPYLYDWSTDNKNQGPYDSYTSEGTYTLTTPPLRPGNTYYLGFHALSDAIFSVSSATSGGTLAFTDLAFYRGVLNNISIPANGAVTYRVKVPADAGQWNQTFTQASGIQFYVEEGTPVDLTRLSSVAPHWSSQAGATSASLVVTLSADASNWPWIAGHTYYLTASNPTGTPLAFSLNLDGVRAAPAFTTQPFDQVVAAWSSASFTVTATGTPLPTFQWQVRTDSGSTWTNLTDTAPYYGSATGTLTIASANGLMNGYQYRCLAINSVASTPSNAATLTVNPVAQTITFPTPAARHYGDAPFNVSATSTSSLPVTYSVVSGPATISGKTVTLTGAGTVTLEANQAGNANYNAATPVDVSFAVIKAHQTITSFPTPANRHYLDPPFNVTAAATTGLPVTFSVVSGPATNSGKKVTLTGAGTVTLRASQAGNANYNAATPVDVSFTVIKATGTVTLGSLSATYDGTPHSVTATTVPNGLAVTFTYGNSATAPTNAGSYAVVGRINDVNYQGGASGTLVIAKAAQTITFPAIANRHYGYAPFKPSATASSGLAIGYSVVSGPATISGSTVTLTGTGTVTLQASQAGNGKYTAAAAVNDSFAVAKAQIIAQANNQTKVQGAANPTLSIAYTGFVNGDTVAVLDTLPTASTTATTGSPVGTYPITLSGGLDNNYSFKLVNGTLTVTASLANQAFLKQLFQDVLGRPISTGELGSFSAAMAGGESRSAVLGDLLASPEYSQRQIEPATRLNYAALARLPDYAGLQSLSGALQHGITTLAGAANQFAVSEAFLQSYGALDNAQYVQQLYLFVLGREADAADLADWVSLLDAGGSRGAVLAELSESDEFKARVANQIEIVRLHFLLLQRIPTAAELQGWQSFLLGDGQPDGVTTALPALGSGANPSATPDELMREELLADPAFIKGG